MIKELVRKTERYTRLSEYLSVIAAIFTCTYFVYRDFGVRMIIGYGVLGAALAVVILRRYAFGKSIASVTPMKAAFFMMTAAVIIMYLRPGAVHDRHTTGYMIAMAIFTAYVIISDPGENESRIMMNIFWAVSVMFSVYVLFFTAFENLYWISVYPLLSDEAAVYMATNVPAGYGVTIGGIACTEYILVFGFACGCGYFVSTRGRGKRRILALLSAVLSYITIFLIGRRSELVSVTATCVVLFILMADGEKRKKRIITFASVLKDALLIFIVLMPVLGNVPFLQRYIKTIENLFSGGDVTTGRMQLWSWALALFEYNPIFGSGWGTFAHMITPEFHRIYGSHVVDAHNDFLQFLCETGIVGTALLVSPIIYCYYQTVKQFSRIHRHGDPYGEDRIVFRMNTTSLVVQTFFLTLSLIDPVFFKYIFWCFYSAAVILECAALKLEGYGFGDGFTLAVRGNIEWIRDGFRKPGKR